ncbi:hypothetical protein ACRE_012880 [Hapsidospora chrysogenum ATCC 11550]|uniref:Rhodopsin domain-containing protein n=1 Tax=Hapsidospora chrysogenum (strain ATCC 11550 / CBS 779.69 / DSM 880 / IAM 14645 / JCM 23072 / IMI 49137) TaxID=857340 RepID=A0A086TEL1_HAPC1|nr:hypothetical protein ACRE_012880 [Hapsidospora chrysogenum ATCC 11550]
MSSPPEPPPLTPDQEARIHEDRGPVVYGVSSAIIALCIIAVALRLVARFNRRMKVGLDDWLAVGGLLFRTAWGSMSGLSIRRRHGEFSRYGLILEYQVLESQENGRRRKNGKTDRGQIGLFNALLYFITHWFIKMSIIAFCFRVFTANIPWFKYALWATGIYTTCWLISSFFAGLFQWYVGSQPEQSSPVLISPRGLCPNAYTDDSFPPAFFWEQYNPALDPPPKGSCNAENAPLVISTSALNTAGDIFVFALPLAMLSRLQLNRAKKISLCGVFATGAFAIAAGVVRLVSTLAAIKLNADTTWITADIYMWTAVEAGVGLICACMPIMGPLFGIAGRRMTQAASSSYRNSRSRGGGGGGGGDRSWNHAKSDTGGGSKASNNFSRRSMHHTHHNSSVAMCDSGGSTVNLELEQQAPQSIIRTDAFYVETYQRMDDSLDSPFGQGGPRAKPISPV